MKVQILQVDPKNWLPVSWLIKLFQRTAYSHYAIGFTSHTGEYMLLQSTSKNIAIIGSERFLSHYNVIGEHTVKMEYSYDDFCRWYEPLLGESYGYLQLFGILFGIKELGWGVTCNELVLRLLRQFTSYEDTDINIRDLNYTLGVVKQYSETHK